MMKRGIGILLPCVVLYCDNGLTYKLSIVSIAHAMFVLLMKCLMYSVLSASDLLDRLTAYQFATGH